jgi:hypothetical protein
MVGMDHLRDAVEHLDLARHEPPLPGGQQLLQIVAARVKEDQLELQRASRTITR